MDELVKWRLGDWLQLGTAGDSDELNEDRSLSWYCGVG